MAGIEPERPPIKKEKVIASNATHNATHKVGHVDVTNLQSEIKTASFLEKLAQNNNFKDALMVSGYLLIVVSIIPLSLDAAGILLGIGCIVLSYLMSK